MDVLVADALDRETTHVFVAIRKEGYKGKRALCPICSKALDARNARTYHNTQHNTSLRIQVLAPTKT